MTDLERRALVGTAGWSKPQWRGHFYPPDLAKSKELDFAARRLASIEINSTSYGLAKPESYLDWASRTPDGFVFAVKGTATATRRLDRADRGLAAFFASGVLLLGARLGPILWQPPATVAFDAAALETFLAMLPRTSEDARLLIERAGLDAAGAIPDDGPRPIRHVVEARNESFVNPAFFAALRRADVAAAVIGAPFAPEGVELTAGFAYARIRLPSEAEPLNESDEERMLDGWAQCIDGWRSGDGCAESRARDVFSYFNSPGEGTSRTPFLAERLQARLS